MILNDTFLVAKKSSSTYIRIYNIFDFLEIRGIKFLSFYPLVSIITSQGLFCIVFHNSNAISNKTIFDTIDQPQIFTSAYNWAHLFQIVLIEQNGNVTRGQPLGKAVLLWTNQKRKRYFLKKVRIGSWPSWKLTSAKRRLVLIDFLQILLREGKCQS